MRNIAQQGMNKQTGEEIEGIEYLQQRFADAVNTERGELVGAREYGMRLDDLVDRNMDNNFAMLAFSRIAEGINHEPNGLFDIKIKQFSLLPDETHTATITIDADWYGEQINLQATLREAA